jgi:hypothetical protein
VNVPGAGVDVPGVGVDAPGAGVNVTGAGVNVPGVKVNVPGVCLRVQKLRRYDQNGGVKGRFLCQPVHIFSRQHQKFGGKVQNIGR